VSVTLSVMSLPDVAAANEEWNEGFLDGHGVKTVLSPFLEFSLVPVDYFQSLNSPTGQSPGRHE
jgi:hypothetical protein